MRFEQVPKVLNWGSAPFSVYIKSSKPVVYTHGLELEVALGPELVFVETLRISNGITEHKFQCEGVSGEWRNVRVQAFQDCVKVANKSLPTKKMVIFGPSHLSIQEGILERFPEALCAIAPTADVEADAVRRGKKKANGKKIRWGDEKEQLVEGPCDGYKYSGWGLETFFTIPNREQLREMCMSMADRQLDSADLDEYCTLDDDDDFVQHFSIFADDQNEIHEEHDHRQQEEVNIDDNTTIFPSENMDVEDDDETESDSDDLEQSIIPQSDSDEETPVEPEVPSRKRVRTEPQEDSKCISFEVETSKVSVSKKIQPIPTSPTCRPADDELRESDFWLLENVV